MLEAREYPKIIAERGQSSMTGCWQEYLRLERNKDGSATLAVCRYEPLASAKQFTDEQGELNFPDEIAGKTAVGVEAEWIVGGELACCDSGWTYKATEICGAIDWVRVNGWVPTNSIVAELFQAPTLAHNRKPRVRRRPSFRPTLPTPARHSASG
jgi:hypothetical protein